MNEEVQRSIEVAIQYHLAHLLREIDASDRVIAKGEVKQRIMVEVWLGLGLELWKRGSPGNDLLATMAAWFQAEREVEAKRRDVEREAEAKRAAAQGRGTPK